MIKSALKFLAKRAAEEIVASSFSSFGEKVGTAIGERLAKRINPKPPEEDEDEETDNEEKEEKES